MGKNGKKSFRFPKSFSGAFKEFVEEVDHLVDLLVRRSQTVPDLLHALKSNHYVLYGLSECSEKWKSSLGSVRIIQLVYRNGLEAYVKVHLDRETERLTSADWVVFSIPKRLGSKVRITYVSGLNYSRGAKDVHSEEFLVRCLLINPDKFVSEDDLKGCVLRQEDRHRQKAILPEFLTRQGFSDLESYINRYPERGTTLHEVLMWHCYANNNGADLWVPQNLNIPSGVVSVRKIKYQNGSDQFGDAWFSNIKVTPTGTLSGILNVTVGIGIWKTYT